MTTMRVGRCDVRAGGMQRRVAQSGAVERKHAPTRPTTGRRRKRAAGANADRRTSTFADAPLDNAFGSWQRIEFIPSPRVDAQPLPPGAYDIRYRVQRSR